MFGMPGQAVGAAAALGGWFDAAASNPFYAKLAFAATALLGIVLIAAAAMGRTGTARPQKPSGSIEDELGDDEPTTMGTAANRLFLWFETLAYIALASLLAGTVVLGIFGSAAAIWASASIGTNETSLIFLVDRMLLVLMVVEILRTVRDSFRSGRLISEPFLIVGLIASIRRVLMITLESSQANRMGAWTPAMRDPFNAAMIELGVLAALILVLVFSIFLLRMSRRYRLAR